MFTVWDAFGAINTHKCFVFFHQKSIGISRWINVGDFSANLVQTWQMFEATLVDRCIFGQSCLLYAEVNEILYGLFDFVSKVYQEMRKKSNTEMRIIERNAFAEFNIVSNSTIGQTG